MYLTERSSPPQRPPSRLDRTDRARPWVGSTLIGLGLTSFFTDISSEMVAAVLPLYVVTQLGFSNVAVGLVDGVSQVCSALLRPLGGALADRYRRYKETAAAGYGLSALARVALATFATTTTAVVGVQFVDRLGKGIRTAPRDAAISLSTPPEALGRAFGLHRTLDTAGALAGPLLAFAVLARTRQNLHTVFVWSALFAFLGLAMLGLLVRNPVLRPAPAPAAGGTGGAGPARRVARGAKVRSLVGRRELAPILGASACLGVGTVGDAFLYLALRDRGLVADRWFPLLFAATAVVYLLLATPLGWLADRVGRARVLLAGYVALLAVYVVLAVSPAGAAIGPRWLIAAVGLVLLGAYYAATDGVLAALVSSVTAATERTTGIAVVTTVAALARFGAAIGFGVVSERWGYRVALGGFAVLLAGGLAGAAHLLGRSRPAPAGAGRDEEEVRR